MPKLYEYLGLEVFFYADEHEPIHVHGRYQDSEIKFTYEPMEESELIEIIRAEYMDGYRIRLWFNDGTERIVDFRPFLCRARHPSFKKYLEVNAFKKFRIVYGNLDWNDCEMCFPVADLYEGEI